MRAFPLTGAGLVLLLVTGNVLAQPQVAVVNVPELRSSLASLLLNERQGPRAVVVDHLWKSNGGTLIARDESLLEARVFADQLVSRIQYDPETETLDWPIVGFAGATGSPFDALALWSVLQTHFAVRRLDEAEIHGLESRYLTAREARPVVVDPLIPPSGLTLPAETLLMLTGYYGTRLFVYSPSNCFDVAMKCYLIGRFDDARVLLSHALAQSFDARYYYFRGTIEMLTGYPEDAKMSALGYLTSARQPLSFSGSYVYERVNGPPAIQFRHLATEFALRL